MDEHDMYWHEQIGKPPMKRWYRLIDRFGMAYGLTKIVARGDEVLIQAVGEPEFVCEDGVTHPEGIPPPPMGFNGSREQRP
jgi:hypothetical protein